MQFMKEFMGRIKTCYEKACLIKASVGVPPLSSKQMRELYEFTDKTHVQKCPKSKNIPN